MKSAKQLISTVLIKEGIKYIEKNPMENFPKLLNWAEKLITKPEHKRYLQLFRNVFDDPDNNFRKLIERFFTELHPNSQKKFLINYMVNAGMVGNAIIDKNKNKYGINIPWAILMDPTAACNMKCTGCWAAEYDKVASMSKETLDRIIREGKELGIHMYIYSGGEPLVRKRDLIELAEKHDDCMFMSFTNGTLIDEAFAKEMVRVGNFFLTISVEGFEEDRHAPRKGYLQEGYGSHGHTQGPRSTFRIFRLLPQQEYRSGGFGRVC